MQTSREVLSPMVQSTKRLSLGTPQEYISPSTRRHVGAFASPATSTFMTPSLMNDDEAEKKERRRSKVLERRHLNSPAISSDRRQSAPLSGLSNTQLADHYANCIKLSAENKINAKNAFGLHLIDYMSELLKKKDMTNFQVASSTLDASAKIYAGRVDAIHTEAYKVLSGLGRGARQKEGDGAGEHGEAGDGDEEEDGPRKRKRARKSNTVETNLKNINVNKFDLEFEVDPLFHQTSAAFDEGGTGGLLLNHLRCLEDTSELILDSNTVLVPGGGGSLPNSQTTQTQSRVDLRELRDLYAGVNVESLQICPAFADFEFTNWDRDGESTSTSLLHRMAQSNHAFDLDAEAEPLPDSQGDYPTDDVVDDFGGLCDDGDDDNDAASECPSEANLSTECIQVGDGKQAQLVQNAIKDMKHGTIGTLMQVLASEPSDYSYFNTDLLQTWAGPEHWKLQPKSKDAGGKQLALAGAVAGRDSPTAAKKQRDKKEPLIVYYDEDIDFDQCARETRAATTLTKATLDKYSKSQTTLPDDLHYKGDQLFQLFTKRKVMIKRQKNMPAQTDLEEKIEGYDYDNANDRDNFCPGVEDADGGGDHDDDNEGGFDLDFTAGTNTFSQSQDSEGTFAVDNESNLNGTLLGSDSLVAQPKKVAKIDIGYARAAKKVDVKRLKSGMWKILTVEPVKESTAPENNDKEGDKDPDKGGGDVGEADEARKGDKRKDADEEGGSGDRTNSVAGQHSFRTMVQDLPKLISKNMARNLSVPIAFVCLLHLANEKTLDIQGTEEMDDLIINQG